MESANDSITNPPEELEESLEASLVTRLAAAVTLPVEGFLAPSSVGSEKRLSQDTFIGVKIDQASQNGDYVYRAPFTFTALITVRFAQADDATGGAFRDECRKVRANLNALLGDGCTALNSSALECDSFVLDSTSSSFEAGDNPVFAKSYSATIKCRQINNITEA